MYIVEHTLILELVSENDEILLLTGNLGIGTRSWQSMSSPLCKKHTENYILLYIYIVQQINPWVSLQKIYILYKPIDYGIMYISYY